MAGCSSKRASLASRSMTDHEQTDLNLSEFRVLHAMHENSHHAARAAPAHHTHNDVFDKQRLFLQIYPDRLELGVLGQQPNDGAFLAVAFHGDFVLQARHHDLAAADFRGAVHRDLIPVEDPGIFHAHAGDLQQVVRPWLKQSRIDLQPRFEVLFGENGLAGGHPAYERQPDLLPHCVLELDPPRSAGHERDDALAGQGPQMLLGCVGGAEAQLVRDFGARRRHTGIGDEALDQTQDLCLARGKVGHFACLFIYTATVIISRSASTARGLAPALLTVAVSAAASPHWQPTHDAPAELSSVDGSATAADIPAI